MDQAPLVEARVAVTDEFDRHRMDACHATVLARRELGQLEIEPLGKALAEVADLALDQVKIVEQPFGRGCHRLALADVLGERLVGMAQEARVVAHAGEQAARVAARVPGEGEARGQVARPLFEMLGTEHLAPEGAGAFGADR